MADEPLELQKTVEPKETKTEVDVDGFLKELEAFGVENPQQLQGKLQAGTEAGRIAQLLGETRKEAEELRKQLAETRKPQPREDFDYTERPIDIESAIERSVEKVLTTREKKMLEAQEAAIAQYQRIQTDKSYRLVRDVWEAKLKDPTFVHQIQTGRKNAVEEYTETVRDFYEGMLGRAKDTINQLRGSAPKPKVPFMEQDGKAPEIIPEVSENRAKVDKFKEKVHKGGNLSADEEAAALDAILGKIYND